MNKNINLFDNNWNWIINCIIFFLICSILCDFLKYFYSEFYFTPLKESKNNLKGKVTKIGGNSKKCSFILRIVYLIKLYIFLKKFRSKTIIFCKLQTLRKLLLLIFLLMVLFGNSFISSDILNLFSTVWLIIDRYIYLYACKKFIQIYIVDDKIKK